MSSSALYCWSSFLSRSTSACKSHGGWHRQAWVGEAWLGVTMWPSVLLLHNFDKRLLLHLLHHCKLGLIHPNWNCRKLCIPNLLTQNGSMVMLRNKGTWNELDKSASISSKTSLFWCRCWWGGRWAQQIWWLRRRGIRGWRCSGRGRRWRFKQMFWNTPTGPNSETIYQNSLLTEKVPKETTRWEIENVKMQLAKHNQEMKLASSKWFRYV